MDFIYISQRKIMNLDFIQLNEQQIEILKYVSIPVGSGFIGWLTNWFAIVMTFSPLEFWGIKPYLGWQGIIPSKTPKMAAISVDLMTQKLLNLEELFERIDPKKIAIEMRPSLEKISKNIIEEVMKEQAPLVWERLPINIKKGVYKRVSDELPGIIEEMMTDIKKNIHELLDFKKMIIDALVNDKRLMNDIFKKCGAEEFKFIERPGWYFGALFGLIQMVVWYYYKGNWVLPVFGVIVGYATNWLALKLIFQPEKPIKIGPWTLQGLFIKRQNEVSDEYGKIIASKILNAKSIFETLLNGPSSNKLVDLIERNAIQALDTTLGMSKPFVTIAVGTERYMKIKNLIISKFIRELPKPIESIINYSDEAFDLEKTLSSKMKALPPDEFVGVLRPAFQEEEFTLIMVGAMLGGVAGLLQYLVVFSG